MKKEKIYDLDGEKMNWEELSNYAEENSLDIDETIQDANKLTEAEVINPENEQDLINAIIDADDADYEEARKELTITSQYHDWHNTIADRINDAIDNDEIDNIDDETIAEYNRQVEYYNQYGDFVELNNENLEKRFCENHFN